MTFSHFLGVDPGRHGALCILNLEGQIVELHGLPTVPQTGFIKTRLDPTKLRALLCPADYPASLHNILAAVESVWVRPTDTRSSGAALVQSAALAEGVLIGLGAKVIRPLPQTWRRAMLGERPGKGKGPSLARAAQLWPTFLWTDDNKAEAALLARFAWLQRLQRSVQIDAQQGERADAGLMVI